MRSICLIAVLLIASGCKPGEGIKGPKPKQEGVISPLGSDAIPSSSKPLPLPQDPEEEVKATEPAVIGGAYLYCDADAEKAGPAAKEPMVVACRLGNVSDSDWAMADKQTQVMNRIDGAIMDINVVMTMPGSPYQMLLTADRAMLGVMELQLSMALPQGLLEFSSTVTHFVPELAALRLSKGLTFAASAPSAKELPVTDRKTWNRWMPVKIPKTIPIGDFTKSGKGAPSLGQVDLTFDDTICTYRSKDLTTGKGGEQGDLEFVSCTKPSWEPELWVRSKAMSLTIPQNPANIGAVSIGVILESSP